MATQMICHYEVLGVNRDVLDVDLKKAYRKMALKWHPDKNRDNMEECTEKFAVIQKAFDVLSDSQERAWYDNHREAILKGYGDDYGGSSVNLMKFFTTSAYSGFGDDAKGFFAVYSEAFREITKEDLKFMEGKKAEEIPEFGTSDSSYEDIVHPFYAYWQSYSTSRSFVWVETYDTRNAPNRRVARLMEKDNKKLRDAAKKEYNEEVRALVSFVRKRDKRVQAYRKLLEEKNAERARLDAEKRERKRIEREKQFRESAKQGAEVRASMEEDLRQVEAALQEEFGDDSEGSTSDSVNSQDEELVNDLFCVACNKDFKSEKAFANHQNSKKHKENVTFLKEQMAEEAAAEEEEEEGAELVNGKEEDSDLDLDDPLNDADDSREDSEEITETNEPVRNKLSKKQKKRRNQHRAAEIPTPIHHAFHDDILEDLPAEIADRLRMTSPSEPSEDDLSRRTVSSQDETRTEQAEDVSMRLDGSVNAEGEDLETEKTTVKLKGKKAKEARRAAREKVASQEPKTQVQSSSEVPLTCNICHNEFPTRNKLFNHIKSTGHALHVSDTHRTVDVGEKSNSRSKKKGKRK